MQVSGTFGNVSCKFPCSSCVVSRDHMSDTRKKSASRSVDKMKSIVAKIRQGIVKAEAESVHPVDVRSSLIFVRFVLLSFLMTRF